MPTATESAQAERELWAGLVHHWSEEVVPDLWADRVPTEVDVVVFYDPAEDLSRRAGEWGHRLPGNDLSSLASFAAGLATAEAEGWETGARDIATRAYEARRFLLADRLVHWAVPWLDTVGLGHQIHRKTALADRDILLALADEARVAPLIPGREGIHVDGEDSYGQTDPGSNLSEWERSLWSGAIVMKSDSQPDLAGLFEDAAKRWAEFASDHAGSAQLWLDLSQRAVRSSEIHRSV